MKICLIGDGLTNLILAKILANKKVNVSICFKAKKANNFTTRTIGISKHNFNFLKKYILNLNKICWPIKYIKIFNEHIKNEGLLNFGSSNDQLFYLIKQTDLFNLLINDIKKNKFIKKKEVKNSFFNSIQKNKNFDIIINSDTNNKILNEIFYKKIKKDYNSVAITTMLGHQKCINNTAFQIFTKFGPIAFLPCSKKETSIVFSIFKKYIKKTEKELRKIILTYNKFYKVNSFSNFEKFNLKFFSLRKYYSDKILCFGDNLHRIHPLAGQGFNMTLRDIKMLSDLIDEKLNLGLPLDHSLFKEFESKTKHLNYIFSFGVNFINEFFKIDNKYSSQFLKVLGKNKLFNKYALRFADRGLII